MQHGNGCVVWQGFAVRATMDVCGELPFRECLFQGLPEIGFEGAVLPQQGFQVHAQGGVLAGRGAA